VAASLRERALERTFSLYTRHLGLWLSLVAPIGLSAGVVWLLVQRALSSVAIGQSESLTRALAAMPSVAAGVWLVAGVCGGQALALAAFERGEHVRARAVLPALLACSARLLAVGLVLLVSTSTLVLLGLGLAGALAHVPLLLLPAAGASATTAKSLALLVLVPSLVASIVPAMWWFGRHVLALPLAAVAPLSAGAALREARRLSRGRLGTILGLFVVTALASNVAVLLARAAGSLVTLIVVPERFRPIFGTGPWKGAAGPEVQLVTTILASLLTLPLVTLTFSVAAFALVSEARDPLALKSDPPHSDR
jgi:hypothetical protein